MFLDLFLTIPEELIKEAKIGGTLGCSGHAVVKFVILRKKELSKSKVGIPNFRRVNLRLFKDLLPEIPWEAVLTAIGV